jgi:dCMP deaminase
LKKINQNFQDQINRTFDIKRKWSDYFFNIVKEVSSRSACMRRKVGAIIVKEKCIISTGYNGPPVNVKLCIERGGCIRNDLNLESGQHQNLCYAVHAEMNAIAHAAKLGISLQNSTLYCNTKPCSICTKLIINTGIHTVFYKIDYNDDITKQLSEESGILFIKISEI